MHDSSSGTPVATRLTTGTLTSGDQFRVKRGDRLLVINGAIDVDITIQTVRVIDGLAVADRVITVPADAERYIDVVGAAYGDEVLFALDSVSNVQIAVLR